MSKPNKQTQKCFAIASTIGAVIKSNNNGEPKIQALQLQINRAMKVFSYKAGRKLYFGISNEIALLWEEIANRHQNEIKEEEIPRFIEYLCMLVPPSDFKKFLGISVYVTKDDIRPEVNARIVESILLLDEGLNRILGTRAHTLTKPKQKQIKEKRTRDKKVITVKTTKVSSAKIKKSEERKRKTRLRKMIKAAKEKKEEKERNLNDR